MHASMVRSRASGYSHLQDMLILRRGHAPLGPHAFRTCPFHGEVTRPLAPTPGGRAHTTKRSRAPWPTCLQDVPILRRDHAGLAPHAFRICPFYGEVTRLWVHACRTSPLFVVVMRSCAPTPLGNAHSAAKSCDLGRHSCWTCSITVRAPSLLDTH